MSDPFSAVNEHHVGYSGSWLDRAETLRRDPERLSAAKAHPAARWLVFDDLKPIMEDERELLWVPRGSVANDEESVFLGLDEGSPRFAISMSAQGLPGTTMEARQASTLLDIGPRPGAAAIVAQGRSVLAWHARNRFCPNCGSPTVFDNAGYLRRCDVCGSRHRPKTDPVAIMLPVCKDMVLVARQPGFPRGIYSALAGFVEPGESFEDAVRREVLEEVGLRTGRIRYVASQPWPFPSSLMIAALAEVESMEIRVDAHELEEARWVSRREVMEALAVPGDWAGAPSTWVPPRLAIAHTMLRVWAEN